MKRQPDWREAILALPVFDTHTHMNLPGVPMAARNIWDIVEYFWFRQELESVGYPRSAGELPEAERIDRFAEAFGKARNTTWARVIQDTFRTLHGMELSDAASIRRADEAVRATSADPAWPRQVIDRLHIQRITTNLERDVDFPGLSGVGAAVPIWSGTKEWIDRLLAAGDPRAAGEEAREAIRQDVAGLANRGFRGMRVQVSAFDPDGRPGYLDAVLKGDQLPRGEVGVQEANAFIAHGLLQALGEQNGMFAQLFLGIQALPGCGEMMGVGHAHTVAALYPLFQRYACDFELIAGAPRLNMDVAQAARLYANVHAGGLWWYNFRPSTYREAMRARLEAVPASKCTLLASDGRCIEWCYAKTRLVKILLADFLYEQVAGDHIHEADALWVAREWLHDAAARRYV